MPPNVYLNNNIDKTIVYEGQEKGKIMVTTVKSVKYDNGIFVYYDGAEYPQKGLATPEILHAVNIVKAVFIGFFKLRPNICSCLEFFNRIGNKALNSYFIKDEFRTVQTKELDRLVFNFLFLSGFKEIVARDFARIFSHLIEYDNAYRLRFLDIASETKPIWLIDDTRNELKRLLNLIIKREEQHKTMVSNKFKYVIKFLLFILLTSKNKQAFRDAVRMSTWTNMVMDDADRYWAYMRKDYNFSGLSYDQRSKILEDAQYSLPKLTEYVV